MQLADAPLPDWIDEFDAIVASFERNGFSGPLNRYRNFARDWEDLAAFDNPHRPTGERDSTQLWLGVAIERQAQWLPAHTGTHRIRDCGHWVQQERTEQVNELLLDFLERASVIRDAPSRCRSG
jgi:pimeloyl-ACP methyl ester carboxylesterase